MTENVSDADRAFADITRFVDRVCACVNKACADEVNREFTTWSLAMAKTQTLAKPDPRSAELMDRYADCMTKLQRTR